MHEKESVEETILHEDNDLDTLEEHSWVQWYQKSWLEIEEGETGGLVGPTVAKVKAEKSSHAKTEGANIPIRKGLIRFVYLIFDYSGAMDKMLDYKPNRCDFLLHQLTMFLDKFFLENPLSYISIAALRNGTTEIVTRMNGQLIFQKKELRSFFINQGPVGPCSLVTGFDWVFRSVLELPAYATREVILVWGSLASVDAKPIFPYLGDRLREQALFVNAISMSPEVFAVKNFFADKMIVVQNAAEFELQLLALVEPKPNAVAKPVYVKMGFPVQKADKIAKCACHKEMHDSVFVCPQCGAPACELPTNCAVCKLTLVSKDMLTRVHRLLYETPRYVAGSDEQSCFGCDDETSPMQCSACGESFCARCDAFVHDVLKHCPGCLTSVQ